MLVGVHFLIDAHGLDNPLDRALRKTLLSKAFRARNRDSLERWTRAVESTILAFSDTQLVTSLAILISGYLQLSCGLSLYHWQTVVDLAWFSALTHLTTLTSLRHQFRTYPFMATCRILVMGIVLILLSVAFVPTGYALQINENATFVNPTRSFVNPTRSRYEWLMSSPAVCLLSPAFKDAVHAVHASFGHVNGLSYNVALVALSLAYLLISYGCRVVRIYTPLALMFENRLKVAPLCFLQCRYQSATRRKHMPRNRVLGLCYRALLLVTITLAEAFYETSNSMLWEVVWLSAALAWGTLRLIGLRAQSNVADEDQWGFGQILPLVLSILPIWWLFTLSFDLRRPGNATSPKPWNIKRFPTMRSIKKATWFRSFTSLIIGMLTVLAMYLLFDLPGASIWPAWSLGLDRLVTGIGLGYTLIKYLFAFAFSVVVWTAFVGIALANHFRTLKASPPKHTYPKAVNVWGPRKLRNGLWCVTVLILLALQVAFIVTMLIYPAWLVYVFYL